MQTDRAGKQRFWGFQQRILIHINGHTMARKLFFFCRHYETINHKEGYKKAIR
jgi:1,4-dihydroxy-2-naphthoyl-CoA synthase